MVGIAENRSTRIANSCQRLARRMKSSIVGRTNSNLIRQARRERERDRKKEKSQMTGSREKWRNSTTAHPGKSALPSHRRKLDRYRTYTAQQR